MMFLKKRGRTQLRCAGRCRVPQEGMLLEDYISETPDCHFASLDHRLADSQISRTLIMTQDEVDGNKGPLFAFPSAEWTTPFDLVLSLLLNRHGDFIMLGHRFGVGDVVSFHPMYRWSPRDQYQVIRLLPPGEDRHLQYRLRLLNGSEEKVASEIWLREAF